MTKPLVVDQQLLEHITEQVDGLRYGHVVITVHDGRVVQIDRTERTRFDQPTQREKQESRKQSSGEHLPRREGGATASRRSVAASASRAGSSTSAASSIPASTASVASGG